MTLRSRLMLAAGGAVAVAVALASATAYLALRHQLRAEVDRTLAERAQGVIAGPFRGFPFRLPLLGGPGGYIQLVNADGSVDRDPRETVSLPVTDRAVQVAQGTRDGFIADQNVAGIHLRVLTTPFGPTRALQIARPLTEQDRTLRRMGLVLLLGSGGGILLALLLGYGVARASLAPVSELTDAVDHVATTHDLTRRIDVRGRDEVARLATRFNEMLGELEASLQAQQQLVADASHELRTPLTSLRTNLEVLAREAELPADDRERLRVDVSAQLEELSTLVQDLIELARGRDSEPLRMDVRLDELAERAVDRARRHAPEVTFETDLHPTVVNGVAERIDRALANLLDNAAKWSPPGGTVEVSVRDGEVSVRDHGPGIAEDDLPFVFDRFYRARAARGLPGSGLGLAIVRQVADVHHGFVVAEAPEGGGTRLRLRLSASS
jgi:two-component system sensor histidine kinase MprB